MAIYNPNANNESRIEINFSDQPKNRQQFISKRLRDKLLQNNYELELIKHCNLEIKNFKEIVVLGENYYYAEEVYQHNFFINLKIRLFNIKAFVALHDFNANSVKIIGSNPQNNISLKNLNFSELIFKNVNANDIILENIKCLNSLNTKFEWNEVRFTTSTFYLVDLSNAKSSIIRKSPIEKITVINSLFPPFINFSLENEVNKENSLGYEFYRQLKTAFLKNNNTIQALQAHSKMFEYAMKRDDLDPWDKFILKLNHFSNRNGTSIAHALKTILLVTLISFVLLILSSPIDSDYCFSTWLRLNIYNRLNLIFYLLNPIFKVEDISKILSISSISFYQHFIMFMTRIGIGWSFYQFIAAFRKFGKH